MTCPICRKKISRENPEYPFCSERCRTIDLGNWAALTLIGTMIVAAAMTILWRYDSSRGVAPLLQFASVSSSDAVSTAQRMLSDSRWLGTGGNQACPILNP